MAGAATQPEEESHLDDLRSRGGFAREVFYNYSTSTTSGSLLRRDETLHALRRARARAVGGVKGHIVAKSALE